MLSARLVAVDLDKSSVVWTCEFGPSLTSSKQDGKMNPPIPSAGLMVNVVSLDTATICDSTAQKEGIAESNLCKQIAVVSLSQFWLESSLLLSSDALQDQLAAAFAIIDIETGQMVGYWGLECIQGNPSCYFD